MEKLQCLVILVLCWDVLVHQNRGFGLWKCFVRIVCFLCSTLCFLLICFILEHWNCVQYNTSVLVSDLLCCWAVRLLWLMFSLYILRFLSTWGWVIINNTAEPTISEYQDILKPHQFPPHTKLHWDVSRNVFF